MSSDHCQEEDKDQVEQFINDLILFRDGRLSAEYIRDKYWDARAPLRVAKVMPYVEHYLSDADIRLKDPDYAAMQNECLCELIHDLRCEEGSKRKKPITFLGYPSQVTFTSKLKQLVKSILRAWRR